MPGSATRALVALVFNFIIAAIFRFFGASLATCWFTFLALTLLFALTEIGKQLDEIRQKLDDIGTTQGKSEGWTDVLVHALARIESKVDAISSSE